MGNSINELNQRIERDKQTRIDSSYINELADEEEEEDKHMYDYREGIREEPKYKQWLNKCMDRDNNSKRIRERSGQEEQQKHFNHEHKKYMQREQEYQSEEMSSSYQNQSKITDKEYNINKQLLLQKHPIIYKQKQNLIRLKEQIYNQLRREHYRLLDILENLVREFSRNGESEEEEFKEVHYEWEELGIFLDKEERHVYENYNISNKKHNRQPSIDILKLKNILSKLITNYNNTTQPSTTTNPESPSTTKQLYIYSPTQNKQHIIITEKITIDQFNQQEEQEQEKQEQQQLYNNNDRYNNISDDIYINNNVNNKRELLTIDKILYQWRVKVAELSLKYTPNELPIVHIYEYHYHNNNKHNNNKSSLLSFNNLFNKTTNTINNNNINTNQSSPYKLIIYQEFIPYQLSTIRILTHLQGIYVLEQSLLGFMMLYHVIGGFDIYENMIGFTYDGRVKVWLSPMYESNLCRQYKKFEKESLSIILTEQQMVTTIYMLVQKYSLFTAEFIYQSRAFRHCTFEQAIDIIQKHKYELIVKNRLSKINQNQNQENYNEEVKFVTRLLFEGDFHKEENDEMDGEGKDMDYVKFYRNNLFLKEIVVNNRDIRISKNLGINKNTISKLNTINDITYKNNLLSQITKPNINLNTTTTENSYKKPLHLPTTITSLSSHITILNSNNNTNTHNRPSIFNNGYERSMSNNESGELLHSERNNHLESEHDNYEYNGNINKCSISRINMNNSNNNNSNNFTKNIEKNNKYYNESTSINTNPHATFVTIKSQQR